MKLLSRREFIGSAAGLAASFLFGCGRKDAKQITVETRTPKFDPKKIVVASAKGPAGNVRAAIDALGGIEKLVKKNDFVVIKPNIAWNRPPQSAATTNPELVAQLVRMCTEAGAERVLVVDNIVDRPASGVLGLTGIGPAAKQAGAQVGVAPNESDYVPISIPKGKALNSDTCIKEILRADVFINVPIAKVHSATNLTLGLKNLMGCTWDRQSWHLNDLDQCIADYATAIKPDLTVLDATRILLSNGPKGPGKTKTLNKVIVGVDPVAVDAFGATLFGMNASDIGHIHRAHELEVGEIDLRKVRILSV